MSYILYLIVITATVFSFSWIGIFFMRGVLVKLNTARMPEARDNHRFPTPSGAGVIVMPMIALFLLVASAPMNIVAGMCLLAAISFYDDVHGLDARKRLGFQAIAVVVGLSVIPGLVLQGVVPKWLEYLPVALAWLWCINLHNFMDGIDEITSVHTAALCVGLMAMAWSSAAIPDSIAIDAAIIIAGMAAFYVFNRHPAKIFFGDAGSVPLGLLIGYLLLSVAGYGYLQAALILPAYYVTDATVTLLRRARAKKPLLEAHSEHAYQQSVRMGRNHHETVRYILALQLGFAPLAVMTTLGDAIGWVCVVIAYGASATLMHFFSKPVRVEAEHVTPETAA